MAKSNEKAVRSRQQALVLLLRKKFGAVPQSVVGRIEATMAIEQLDRWLEELLPAQKLADVGIKPLK